MTNRYREITKKYLDYNDKEKNPDAFLRTPQFEALEMYVFVKEFMNNQQMYQMFDDWSKRNGVFSDRRFYDEAGQITLYDVYSPKQYHDYFLQIKKYNKHHKDNPLPHITPHTLRHTFCTRLASKNMNPKDLQYIMGHSNISITMNWYAHASIDTAKSEVQRLIA